MCLLWPGKATRGQHSETTQAKLAGEITFVPPLQHSGFIDSMGWQKSPGNLNSIENSK
jgi:hypothetical protein